MRIHISIILVVLAAGCAGQKADKAADNVIPIIQTPKPAIGAIYHQQTHVNLYSDKDKYRVGDIVSVVLAEKTSASKNANTKLQKNAKAGLELDQLLSADLAANRSNSGSASAGQANSLSGQISVVVNEVLPNNLLRITGSKTLTLNNGDEIVTISGIIRSDDIDSANQIASNKVANAQISYTGKGVFSDSSKPGWLSRILFSPWFIF